MVRLLSLLLVVFGLSGCPDPKPGGGGNVAYAPYPSNVVESVSGQKYFVTNVVDVYSTATPPKALYAWDAGIQAWVNKATFASDAQPNEIYIDSIGDIWLNDFSYPSAASIPVTRVDTQTFQTSTYSPGSNQFLVGGDQAVEYQGSLVSTYQPTTGASTYLYNLPSSSAAAQAMGITLNAQPYNMLCMPVLKYAQWDGMTHYCMLANDVQYFTNLPPVPSAGNNDIIEFTVSITNAGNTYQLLDHFQTPLTAILQSPPLQENFAADFPVFASLESRGCGGSVDKQGDYHQFCNDTGDYTKFTYRFYHQAAPSTPLYMQVLP